jgi:hypothetical protein
MERSVDVFPAPLAPRMATMPPVGTFRLIPRDLDVVQREDGFLAGHGAGVTSLFMRWAMSGLGTSPAHETTKTGRGDGRHANTCTLRAYFVESDDRSVGRSLNRSNKTTSCGRRCETIGYACHDDHAPTQALTAPSTSSFMTSTWSSRGWPANCQRPSR